MGYSSFGNTAVPLAEDHYIPRGRNELHKIFDNHFADFCEQYDENYAEKYGMFRLERIQQIGENFSTCGDYLHGIVRIHGYAMFPALVRKWPNELVHFTHSVWESGARILSVEATISVPFPARGFIFVHPAVRREHYCSPNI